MSQPLGTQELGTGFPFSNDVTQTGYCSQADIERKIGKQKLAELTNDAFTYGKSNDGAEPDVDVVQQMIDEADSIIDSIIGTRYAVPFAQGSIPEDIRFASINISAYLCFKRRLNANKITEDWQKTYNETIEDLKKMASGELSIGDVDVEYAASAMVVPTTGRQTDFYDTDNQISKF